MKKKNGFTLVEVLITLVILCIGLLGMAQLMVVGIRSNVVSKQITTASVAMQDKMEQLRNERFNAICSGSDSFVRNGFSYSRSWAVSNVNANTKLVTISVCVDGRTVSSSTLIGE